MPLYIGRILHTLHKISHLLYRKDFVYPTHTFLALFSSSVCLYLHLLKGSFDNKMELNYTAFAIATSLCYEDDPTSTRLDVAAYLRML